MARRPIPREADGSHDHVEVLGGSAPVEEKKTRAPRVLPPEGVPTEPPTVDAPMGAKPPAKPAAAPKRAGPVKKDDEGGEQLLLDGSKEEPELDSGPETPWRVFRDGGALVVEFNTESATFAFNKRQCVNLTGHMSVEARELPVISRNGDEAPDEIDVGAEITLDDGFVNLTFTEPIKQWALTKLAAKLAIGEIRAKASVLPSKSAG